MGEAKRKRKRLTLEAFGLKPLSIIILLIVLVAVMIVTDQVQRRINSPMRKFDPARVKGQPGAEIQIIEFIDFSSPESASGSILLQNFYSKYPQRIYLAVKLYPMPELNSMASSIYAYCAARQNKFWQMHNAFFEKQPVWSQIREVEPYFNLLAKQNGLNMEELKMCVHSTQAQKEVLAEKTLGESYFVYNVPTYFVNHEMVVGQDELMKKLESYFKEHL